MAEQGKTLFERYEERFGEPPPIAGLNGDEVKPRLERALRDDEPLTHDLPNGAWI